MENDTYMVSVDDTVVVPLGRRNVRPRVKDQDPQDAYLGVELPIDPYHVIAR